MRWEAITVLTGAPTPPTGRAASGCWAPRATCCAGAGQNAAMRASSSSRTMAALLTCPYASRSVQRTGMSRSRGAISAIVELRGADSGVAEHYHRDHDLVLPRDPRSVRGQRRPGVAAGPAGDDRR